MSAHSRSATTPDRQELTPLTIGFRHGLGDCVFFAHVLQLYRSRGFDIQIDCEPNKRDFFNLLGFKTGPSTPPYGHPWHQPYGIDATLNEQNWWRFNKAVRNISCDGLPDIGSPESLVDELLDIQLDPLVEVMRSAAIEIGRYVAPLLRPIVLLHATGNTNQAEKSIPHEQIISLCEALLQKLGGTVLVLDWDGRNPAPGQSSPAKDRVRFPCREGLWLTPARLIELMRQTDLLIGVDSGPLHLTRIAGSRAIGVWRGHCHPVYYSLPRDLQVNYVQGRHDINPRVARAFRIVQQPDGDDRSGLDVQLLAHVAQHAVAAPIGEHWPEGVALAGERFDDRRRTGALSSKSFGGRYYDEHRAAGLDYLGHGTWQIEYGRWLVDVFGWKDHRVLDVGCACGSILRGLRASLAIGEGVDVSEHMIRLGRTKWEDMAAALHVCDAVNLHVFEDSRFTGLHSAQVAEHWKPELVPHILAELRRVTAPGGHFFCVLDTAESFTRQGRKMEQEDPTHVCIQTLPWWRKAAEDAGWRWASDVWTAPLSAHPGSYFSKYDWDWFVLQKSN